MESNSAATSAVRKAERKEYPWVRRLADPTAAMMAAKWAGGSAACWDALKVALLGGTTAVRKGGG